MDTTISFDDSICYFENHVEYSFFTQLLESTIRWLCSENSKLVVDGFLFIHNNQIYLNPNDNTEDIDVSNVFLSSEHLDFVNQIYNHIRSFCDENSKILKVNNLYLTIEDIFYNHYKNHNNYFLFNSNEIIKKIYEIQKVSNGLYYYHKTNCNYLLNEQQDITNLYNECVEKAKDKNMFHTIIENLDSFNNFIRYCFMNENNNQRENEYYLVNN
jgi:hypothetical protein